MDIYVDIYLLVFQSKQSLRLSSVVSSFRGRPREPHSVSLAHIHWTRVHV